MTLWRKSRSVSLVSLCTTRHVWNCTDIFRNFTIPITLCWMVMRCTLFDVMFVLLVDPFFKVYKIYTNYSTVSSIQLYNLYKWAPIHQYINTSIHLYIYTSIHLYILLKFQNMEKHRVLSTNILKIRQRYGWNRFSRIPEFIFIKKGVFPEFWPFPGFPTPDGCLDV